MLSVIIPLYNAQDYIGECLDSVLGQDYQDYEVVVVDDGSTDNSLAIAMEYAERDTRIVVFTKQNGGVSSARNFGIEHSRGAHLMFLDADDMLAPEAIKKLMEGCNSDISVCGMRYYPKADFVETPPTGLFSGAALRDYISEGLDKVTLLKCSCWKIYKKEIVLEQHLCFDTKLKYGEDTAFLHSYLAHCKTLYSIDYVGYLYRHDATNSQYFKKFRHTLEETFYTIEMQHEAFDQMSAAHGILNHPFKTRNTFPMLRSFFNSLSGGKMSYAEFKKLFSDERVHKVLEWRCNMSCNNKILLRIIDCHCMRLAYLLATFTKRYIV